MRIRKLKLFTKQLGAEKKFYSKTLGFEIISYHPSSFTLKIGWTELTFESSDRDHKYHYCFLIPANKLIQAKEWMEKRTHLIDLGDGRKIQHFKNWNADSFYFYDASGNIAEFIVRYDLNNNSHDDFNLSDVLCVNEIGMPSSDVEKTNAQLQEKIGTQFWKGDPKRFGTNGTQEGLFLLPNYTIKKIWFPTSIIIQPEPFEIVIENKGEAYFIAFDNEIISLK